jgi:carbamoyltransferase
MNKRVMELDCVDDLFIQPVSSDAGLAVGAGMLGHRPRDVSDMSTVYWGPEFSNKSIESTLNRYKIAYRKPDDLESLVAQKLADGNLVGWVQGRLEMGPRALGNRSILADSRTVESRDRVNEFVKHREEWRPFAPSMLRSAGEEYLVGDLSKAARFMVDTYETTDAAKESIPATLHPADDTTRPQIVTSEANPRYHSLISSFEARTGVGAVLNTSFNDSGEPMVRSPQEAIRDFYSMGLDVLFIENVMVEK